MIDYKAARTKMVDNQIRTTDVTSHSVLNAFLSVPREPADLVADAIAYLHSINARVEVLGHVARPV